MIFHEEYSWREKRCHMHTLTVPHWMDTKSTTLPEGNAHYSMYGLTKTGKDTYMEMYTRRHKFLEHYSSELIIDVETRTGLEAILQICHDKDWSYTLFDTGSNGGGGHFSIPRDALPSDFLYIRDSAFVELEFENVPDIDFGIYTPMHLIRGIGKIHERTRKQKKLVSSYVGSVLPSVQTFSLSELQILCHTKRVDALKPVISSDWTKFQQSMFRHTPTNIKQGGRHMALYCVAKDAFKTGLDSNAVMGICTLFNLQLENPHSEEDLKKAVYQAERAVCG